MATKVLEGVVSTKKSNELEPLRSSSHSIISESGVAIAASKTLKLNSPLYCVMSPQGSVNSIFKE